MTPSHTASICLGAQHGLHADFGEVDEPTMCRWRRAGGTLMALVTFTAPEPAAASDPLPDNATVARSGIGWECMMGFRRTGNDCSRVAVPMNAYLDASGDQWRCNRGYQRTDDKCTTIKVPINAYLDDSFGSGWRCERGYREAQGQCRAIEIPGNAHSVDSSYGSGWECDRGFRPSDSTCILSSSRRTHSCRAPAAVGNVNGASGARTPHALRYESRPMLIWNTPATPGSATGLSSARCGLHR